MLFFLNAQNAQTQNAETISWRLGIQFYKCAVSELDLESSSRDGNWEVSEPESK